MCYRPCVRRGAFAFVAAEMVVVAACSSAEQPTRADAGEPGHPAAAAPAAGDGGAADLAGAAAAQGPELPGLPPYPPHVRSLRLRRSISVRYEPHEEAKRLGTVARDTRVLFRGARVGPGCETRWIEIEPRGWVCEVHLEPSTRGPIGVELPRLEHGELVPGSYGKLSREARILTVREGQVVGERPLDGSATVRRYGEEVIRGAPHWRIGRDEYVRASLIQPHEPSRWSGTRLGDDTGLQPPLGFAMGEKNPFGRVPVWTGPDAATRARQLEPRALVPVLETATDEEGRPTAHRIGEGAWVRAADLRLVERAAPPPGLRPGERWIDVDLDRQVLVAYEGELPVYATLVSSGARKTPTETGVYRVWLKFAETDMSGGMGDQEAYSVATVPWTQFYAKDLALHTTYWHDKLGTPRSHGCVNLAPRDARFLYFWSVPDVPPGWSMSGGIVERPGSMVRVRSAADPDPPFRGYAMRVAEAQGIDTAR